jgi:outer membrane lipoprotein
VRNPGAGRDRRPTTARPGIPLLPVLLLLAGCATSRVPEAIRESPPRPVAVAAAQRSPNDFLGHRVRWGGTIIAVHNRERTTEIEVLSRPLGADGEPREEEPGEGRFIVLLEGFADPADYPKKRLLTAAGTLVRVETRPVGEYPYPYPVVTAGSLYLWPEPPPPPPPWYYADPWYSPWYRPWRPWYPWYDPWYR